MSDAQHKPCMYCGCSGVMPHQEDDETGPWQIYCPICDATGPSRRSEINAWEAWDRTDRDAWVSAYIGGTKHDTGKRRYDLIPPEALDALAHVLTYGSTRYGDRNWEQGIDSGRVFAAAQRHLWDWWRGEQTDEESTLPHLWHALCNVAFLVAYEERNRK